MNENKMGELIYKLRKSKNMTQNDLAKVLNTSNKAISKWEIGITNPSLEMTYQISKYFNVSFYDMARALVNPNNSDILTDVSKNSKKSSRKLKIIGVIISLLRLIIEIINIILDRII